MPHQPSMIQIRFDSVISCLKSTATLLIDLHGVCGTPFMQIIGNTTLALVTSVEIKKNRDECLQLMEKIYRVICAIVTIHIHSDTGPNLPPATLEHVGKFTETLRKTLTFMEAQQDRKKIKHFFQQSEMRSLLRSCKTGILQALEAFKVLCTLCLFQVLLC
ncbi:hypothetical protein C8R43DRAFT_982589 [Mycena crocata]|nr:hypothetical protein C8R43DRAFT_982589 [Mycena crocata]